MRLLIDANSFLEVLLELEQEQAARTFLTDADKHEFFVSDFALHAVCLIVLRHKPAALLEQFLADTIHAELITQLSLPANELNAVLDAVQLFSLDFDDAYQYVVAEKNHLTLVSFDRDFDKTPRGRQTPQAINQLTAAQNLQDQQ